MHIIIPARYASTRLPGKPLLDIAGKPLIQRVYERALQTKADQVTIATDDDRIRIAAEKFGAPVCMTSTAHRSGTERLAEVIAKLAIAPDEIVANLQGDEPLVPPDLITRVAAALTKHKGAAVATACFAITHAQTLANPNVVKVVRDREGYALYFSRSPIPWSEDGRQGGYRPDHHIGLYAYRAEFVARYVQWSPCPLEQTERLEQLRVLWYGERIIVCRVDDKPEHGVDTPEDLARVRQHFQRGAVNG